MSREYFPLANRIADMHFCTLTSSLCTRMIMIGGQSIFHTRLLRKQEKDREEKQEKDQEEKQEKEKKQKEENEESRHLMLRVYVTGGGCSGFQYGFTFDDNIAEDDTVISNDGVHLVVDALSYQYLVGAEVDYEEGLQGSRFLVKNPNATSTCGCGASFSI